jgi:hypothetical protein
VIDQVPELDEIIEVATGAAYGRPTRCRLRLYRGAGGGLVALVTELAENPGPSVTNAVEQVWAALARRLDTTRFTMVEHYDADSFGVEDEDPEETFDIVSVEAGQPGWQPLHAEGLRRLLASA